LNLLVLFGRKSHRKFIKKSAGIDRHVFALREAAMRTGDDRMKNDVIHDFKVAGSTARSEDRTSQLPGAALNFRH
jgi:hypothetical protein